MSRKPESMWEEDGDGGVIGYMCLVDLECELGAAKGGNIVYPSENDLRENRKCVDQCGIAKVRVIGVEVLQEADYDGLRTSFKIG